MSIATVPKPRPKAQISDPKLDRLIEQKVREFLLHRPGVLIVVRFLNRRDIYRHLP